MGPMFVRRGPALRLVAEQAAVAAGLAARRSTLMRMTAVGAGLASAVRVLGGLGYDAHCRPRARRRGGADLVAADRHRRAATRRRAPARGPLSQHFGVSRTVIRESVKRVEEKGLLTVAQGRGTTVNPPTSWNVLDPVVLSALVDHDDSLGVLDELTVVRGSLEASMAACRGRTADARAQRRARAGVSEQHRERRRHRRVQRGGRRSSTTRSWSSRGISSHRTSRTSCSPGRARAAASSVTPRASRCWPRSTSTKQSWMHHRRVIPARASVTMLEHVTHAWARRRPSPRSDR